MEMPKSYELYKQELKAKGDDYKPTREEYDILGKLILEEKMFRFKLRWKMRLNKLKFWRK